MWILKLFLTVEDKQKAKGQILHLLKMQGAQSAAALAKQLQVTPMAVRQHLQILQAEGWVGYEEEKRPLGRPVKLWQLTELSSHFFADSHADLTVDLLRGIEAAFGTAALEKVLRDRIHRQIQNYSDRLPEETQTADWRQRVAAIAQLRSQDGYMAEVISQPDRSLLLVENHCPIKTAARTCQLLCRAEQEVFKTLLGPEVTVERVEHLMLGARRCAYRIQPGESNDC